MYYSSADQECSVLIFSIYHFLNKNNESSPLQNEKKKKKNKEKKYGPTLNLICYG